METALTKLPGDAVGGPDDNLSRIGHVLLRAGSPAAANAAAEAALASVTVELATRW
ncbi:hypothetical protein MUU72_05850 [Streptomyces sp. RS10V-4]|nr:hypothetical protein [Streptomyces rhizoryzae]MCK7622633.1 hypothetical protein [Streptomyces rhizoryzae]